MGVLKLVVLIEKPEMPDKNIVVRYNGKNNELKIENEEKTFNSDFIAFMKKVIVELEKQGCHRTAENYISALNCLQKFYKEEALPISTINESFAISLEKSMKNRGISLNTSSFYMRILRAVFNRAVRQGIATDCHPFAKVYTAIAKTEKRAIDLDHIQKIKQLECSRKNENLARDLFLFSFYTRGMAFVDMAFLKKQDIRNGYIYYRRHKTGQQLTVKWEPEMERISKNHPSKPDNPYLLPIINNSKSFSAERQYRYMLCMVNKELKNIGQRIGIDGRLTMYVARHSWATIAKSLNIPIEVISEAMGHTNEKTTHIYLKSINANKIDSLNNKILSLL